MKRLLLALVFLFYCVIGAQAATPFFSVVASSGNGLSPTKYYNFLTGTLPSDLTFSRASNATMYDSTGTLVWAPANLLLNSAALGTQTVTVVSGQSYTLSFYGTGSVTLSGGATGTLSGTGASNRVSVAFTASTTSVTFTVSGSVTSGQLEPTSYNSPQAYNATTSSAYYGPRFDTNPSTLTLNGLLIEEQRTNLFLNSQSPVTQSIATTAQNYTVSFYGTGTITLSGTGTQTIIGTGSTVLTQYTFAASAGTLVCTVSGSVANAQVEAGNFATSRIVTTSSAVTRAADSLGSSAISWFSATQGTFFVEFIPELTSSAPGDIYVNSGFYGSNGFSGNGLTLDTNTFAGARFEGNNSLNWGNTTAYSSVTCASGTTYKQGLIYSASGLYHSINGTTPTSASAATLPTITGLAFASSYFGNGGNSLWLRSFSYYNAALSTTQLQTISGQL